MTDQTAHQPLTERQLDEIETRAAHLREYATLTDEPLQADADQLTGEDVPALVAAVRRLRKQRRVLLDSIARKDARTGEGDKALREFLAAPEEASRPQNGGTRGGQHTATVAITISAPTDANADSWAETIADLVEAEYGDTMRLDIRLNPITLPRHGDWNVTRGGVTVYTAATQAEAQAVGTYAIRQETDPRARVEWVCPACVGDDEYCQDCSDGTQWHLRAQGVWTEADYAIERVPAPTAVSSAAETPGSAR